MTQWTGDQQALRSAVVAMGELLSKDHIATDREHTFPRDKWDRLRETGLFGLPFDERYGGLAQDLPTTMHVLEGLGYACRDAGLSFSASTHLVSAGVPVQRFGSAALKERYLPVICDGSVIGAHAITEPDGGSDVMSMRTTAKPDGDDHFVLNGGKTFISNGPIADLVMVYARTGKAGSPAALTVFAVEAGTPGFSAGRPMEKMGLRSSPLSEIFLDDCRVPRSNIVGSIGAGFLVLDYVMKWEILCTFSVTLGEMQHRLERCLDYAKSRVMFGKPIGSFQSISNKLVEMKIGVENSRKWLFDTADKLVRRQNVSVDLAIAKLVTSESNVASALAAIQIFGGHGYMTEHGVEKELRNAVGGTIYSGTSEIQRQRVATLLGL
ncbi:MAG TPA: acyl-CoA dehydrogenase family protein [Pseudonocardiaceae bacterium]|nr:acyl-CoA dehydrogenase family protein [Pseudonocardiaceae bacterium]